MKTILLPLLLVALSSTVNLHSVFVDSQILLMRNMKPDI